MSPSQIITHLHRHIRLESCQEILCSYRRAQAILMQIDQAVAVDVPPSNRLQGYVTPRQLRNACEILGIDHPQVGDRAQEATWALDTAERLHAWKHTPRKVHRLPKGGSKSRAAPFSLPPSLLKEKTYTIPKWAVGDIVTPTRAWVQSCYGYDDAHLAPHHGEVLAILPKDLVVLRWSDDPEPMAWHAANLHRYGTPDASTCPTLCGGAWFNGDKRHILVPPWGLT